MNAKEVIERLCLLQSEVSRHIGFDCSADCFCEQGGFWGTEHYDGTEESGYRNEGAALEFIECAVREKMARDRGE